MTHAPPFAWPWALAFWAVYLGTFVLGEAPVARRSRQTRDEASHAKGDSVGALVAVLAAGQVVALALGALDIACVPPPWRPAAFGAGLAAMVAGSLLRRWCFALLGASFTFDVRAAADQPLVEAGPYRHLRHPSYTGGLLMLAGFGLAAGSLAGAAVATVAGLAGYGWRIQVEEAQLLRVMGPRYAAFARGRKRMIPFVY